MRSNASTSAGSPSFIQGLFKAMRQWWWLGWFLFLFTLLSVLPDRTDFAPKYKGKRWRKKGSTLNVKPIFETPWAYVELHRVKLGGEILNDWLWMDEKPAINVLVRKNGKFLVFQQEKYGLAGQSLAPVGGMIEPREFPLQAAQRELLEEMNLESKKWVELGTFRTAVNRGGGFSTFFLADECFESEKELTKSDDLEKQELIEMEIDELTTKLLNGEFQEVKWTANIALALLHLEKGAEELLGGEKQPAHQEIIKEEPNEVEQAQQQKKV